MRYTAIKNYDYLYVDGETVFWRCKAGDVIDVEDVLQTSVVKLINRKKHQTALSDEVYFNKKEFKKWKRNHLKPQ